MLSAHQSSKSESTPAYTSTKIKKTQREHSVTLVTQIDTRCNVTTSHSNEIMTLYKLTRKDGDLQSLWPASSDVSLAYCCCIAVIACGIGLFNMARASNRLTSVHVNTSQNNSGCEILQRVYRPAGRSHVLKMRKCVHTPVGYNGPLSTVNETCNKTKDTVQKKLSVHIFQVAPHIKIGCTPVRLT